MRAGREAEEGCRQGDEAEGSGSHHTPAAARHAPPLIRAGRADKGGMVGREGMWGRERRLKVVDLIIHQQLHLTHHLCSGQGVELKEG